MATYGLSDLRQLGDQEADIVRMVRGITKYAALIRQPEEIAYHLERAWSLAQVGRPGPCWLDIPVDVQSAQIDPGTLRHYNPSEDSLMFDPKVVAAQVAMFSPVFAMLSARSSLPAVVFAWAVRFRSSRKSSARYVFL